MAKVKPETGLGPNESILDLDNPISAGSGPKPSAQPEKVAAGAVGSEEKTQKGKALTSSADRQKKPQKKASPKNGNGKKIDRERLVSLYAPYSSQGKRIDILRSQLLYPFHGDPPRIVMISSSISGEGTSLLASNLAVSFARGLQQYVMIIDCNLLHPVQAPTFGVPARPGLSDYLEGRGVEVQDIIHWSKVDKLSVIPAGSPSHRSAELLATDKMAGLLQELRSRYTDRYIILDTPPVQVVDDPSVLARWVEAILFVVASGTTDRETVMRALSRLPEERIIGLVLNDRASAVLDAASVSPSGSAGI